MGATADVPKWRVRGVGQQGARGGNAHTHHLKCKVAHMCIVPVRVGASEPDDHRDPRNETQRSSTTNMVWGSMSAGIECERVHNNRSNSWSECAMNATQSYRVRL